MRSCPPGHVLKNVTPDSTEYRCVCGDESDGNIVECLPLENKIVLEVQCILANF